MRKWVFWLVFMSSAVLALLSCVSDSVGTPDAGIDASPIIEASVDVGVDAGVVTDARCDPAKPFGNIEPVAELNTVGDDFGAFLTDDELTAYWLVKPVDAGPQMRVATRGTPTGTFPVGAPVPDLTGPSGSNCLHVSADTKTALVVYVGSWTLQLGTRATTAGPFTGFSPITALNGGANYAATMRSDGAEIFFGSPRNGPKVQIYTSTGSGTSFAPPTTFNQAAASSADDTPVLLRDGKTLYFGSDRPGTAGLIDIWVTRRTGSAPFQAPTRVTELGTSAGEYPTWVSPDECVIYFSRGPVGQRDNYRARKPL